MAHKRINGKTPCGGAYSEIYYFDKDGNDANEKDAASCAIRECDEEGNLLNETWDQSI